MASKLPWEAALSAGVQCYLLFLCTLSPATPAVPVALHPGRDWYRQLVWLFVFPLAILAICFAVLLIRRRTYTMFGLYDWHS